MPAKTVTEVKAIGLKDAMGIHKGRTKASLADLLMAQYILDDYSTKLKSMSEDINECLNRYDFPMIEKELGSNPMLVLDGKVNVTFKEGMVTSTTVDKKAIMGLGGLIPSKYIIEKQDLDKDSLVKDAIDGTLDPSLMRHVSVHTGLELKITKRAVKAVPAAAAGTGVGPSEETETSEGDAGAE